jgi:hypothetical protein
LINIDEYNRILVNGLPYFQGESWYYQG